MIPDFVLLQSADTSAINELLMGLSSKLIGLGEKIIIAVIVYFIGSWLISLLRKLVKKILAKRDVDSTVASFINSLISNLLKIILIIVIIGILGIPATSLAAILAAAGLAIGMAMKDNLANFAGGVMLLLNKPFKVGDRIQAQGQDGAVKGIGILYTILTTGDARTVYIPNGPLSTGSIVNFSDQENRRIDISFNINYGNNADDLKKFITDIISSNNRILKEPAPFVGITTVNNGNFDITIRVWVLNGDYGDVSTELNEAVYKTLSEKGIFTSSSLTVKMANN
ncbi:MAG: mechanosensitive ion channel family protein [Dysgonomonas sp.]